MAYRGIDLLDLWRGRLSPRRVAVLIRGLPPDSATARSMAGHGWSQTDYILADVFDAVQHNTWVTGVSASGKSAKRPSLYPRPGNKKRRITGADLLAFRERTKR